MSRKGGGTGDTTFDGDLSEITEMLAHLNELPEEKINEIINNLSSQQLQALLKKNPRLRSLFDRYLRKYSQEQTPEKEYERRKNDDKKQGGKRNRDIRKPPVENQGLGFSNIENHPLLKDNPQSSVNRENNNSEEPASNEIAHDIAQNDLEKVPSPSPQHAARLTQTHSNAPTPTMTRR